MLHADCKSAHAALGRVRLRNECGDCSESDSNTSGPVAQLGFDGDDDDDDDDDDSDDDNSEEDGSGSDSGNSSPSSPGAQRQRDRKAYEVRRSAAVLQIMIIKQQCSERSCHQVARLFLPPMRLSACDLMTALLAIIV